MHLQSYVALQIANIHMHAVWLLLLSASAPFHPACQLQAVLDEMGASAGCTTVNQDDELVVARPEAVYFYSPDGRGPCFVFEGVSHASCRLQTADAYLFRPARAPICMLLRWEALHPLQQRLLLPPSLQDVLTTCSSWVLLSQLHCLVHASWPCFAALPPHATHHQLHLHCCFSQATNCSTSVLELNPAANHSDMCCCICSLLPCTTQLQTEAS